MALNVRPYKVTEGAKWLISNSSLLYIEMKVWHLIMTGSISTM